MGQGEEEIVPTEEFYGDGILLHKSGAQYYLDA